VDILRHADFQTGLARFLEAPVTGPAAAMWLLHRISR